MIEKEEWTEVEAPSSEEEKKVEYEVEQEEEKVEAQPEAPSDTEPKELDGIETKGAQKRIRQLIKQRKDRDEQINKLIQQNEQLNTKLSSREQEFSNISKMHLDAN